MQQKCSVVRPFKSANFSVVVAATNEELLAFQIFKGSVFLRIFLQV